MILRRGVGNPAHKREKENMKIELHCPGCGGPAPVCNTCAELLSDKRGKEVTKYSLARMRFELIKAALLGASVAAKKCDPAAIAFTAISLAGETLRQLAATPFVPAADDERLKEGEKEKVQS